MQIPFRFRGIPANSVPFTLNPVPSKIRFGPIPRKERGRNSVSQKSRGMRAVASEPVLHHPSRAACVRYHTPPPYCTHQYLFIMKPLPRPYDITSIEALIERTHPVDASAGVASHPRNSSAMRTPDRGTRAAGGLRITDAATASPPAVGESSHGHGGPAPSWGASWGPRLSLGDRGGRRSG